MAPETSTAPPLFECGQVTISASVIQAYLQGRLDPLAYLQRHLRGDWGDVAELARRTNDDRTGMPRMLISSYEISAVRWLYVTTDASRRSTHLVFIDQILPHLLHGYFK